MIKRAFFVLIMAFLTFAGSALTDTVLTGSVFAGPKVLIWDLGGVIFQVSQSHFLFNALGVKALSSYVAFDWKSPRGLEKLMFHALNQIPIAGKNEYSGACAPSGVPLPPAFCAYLAGKIPGKDILEQVTPLLDTLLAQEYFISEREKLLVKSVLEATFDPFFFSQTVYMPSEALSILRDLTLYNSKGHQSIRHIALSNWDPWSFEIVKERFKCELKFFDQIIISGMLGVIKPDKSAFEYLLRIYGLQPGECIFIDDQIANIKAAESLGIPSIHFTTYDELRTRFFTLGMLPEASSMTGYKMGGLALIAAAGIFGYHKGYLGNRP